MDTIRSMDTVKEQIYKQYKSILFGTAYRMLGSVSDAEDIVQDVFIHYFQLQTDDVRNEQAYLTKMTVNRCLNLLQSAKRKREIYIGPWLPEPLADRDYSRIIDPAVRHERIAYAFLVLMQKLTPLERAVYVLRETLQYDYETIADMLGKTEASCRKTFSRAKEKTEGDKHIPLLEPQTEMQDRFAKAFIQATDHGNFALLHDFLLEDVTLFTDGGGKARAALNPIYGLTRVRMFFDGLASKGTFAEGFEPLELNGETGLILRRDGQIAMTLHMEWGDEAPRVSKLYVVVNPDKLLRLNRSSPDTCQS